ncbi:hypothetical protein ACA910_018124 [Epithemia clementina (nom. ined.)]
MNPTKPKLDPQHLLSKEKIKLSSSSSPSSFVLIKDTTAVLPPSLVGQSRLESGAKDALSLCAEAGWLYGRVQSYINAVHQNNDGDATTTAGAPSGSIARAFASALSQELQDYLEFLNQLEQDLDNLHLRKIRVRLREPIRRLQSLAMLTDSLQHLSGGPLLAAIQKHVRSGDPRHVVIANRLLAATSKPWFQMLHLWITEGILSDPALEFFVRQNSNVANSLATSNTVLGEESSGVYSHANSKKNGKRFEWKDGFDLDLTKLPGSQLMGEDLVEPVFRVGKGVNFVRRCLMDGEWTFGTEFVERAKKAFCYSTGQETESIHFRSTLTEAMRTVHSHILESLHRDHHLFLHLHALKQFMFLGHGDFYTVLMDGLSTEFGDKVGVAGIYRHTLTSVLDAALRSTNANYFPPHILERLDIDWDLDLHELHYYGFTETEAGSSSSIGVGKDNNDKRRIWDIFALDYSVPEALVTVVDEDAKADYRRVFRSLFGLRTVEHHLNSTWRTSATLQHTLHSMAQQNGLTVRTSQSYANTIALLRQIAMTRQAMVHFVVNLKSYIMFEVLEGGWKQVVQDIQEAETLDDIVAAHSRYIGSICRKSFLGNEQTCAGALAGYPKLGSLISELLELCKEFCTYQQNVFSVALDTAEHAKEERRQANERAAVGEWFATEEAAIASEEYTFFGLADSLKRNDLSVLSDAFHQKMKALLLSADEILNGVYMASTNRTPSTTSPATVAVTESRDNGGSGRLDDALDSLRFLIFQLDQNSYYEFNHETGIS